jgi:hypothetical protein
MSIDVFRETVLPFAEAAKRLPKLRGGRPVAPSTIYRWAQGGLKGASGAIVRLETVKIGATTCTSLEALQRFFDRLQATRQACPEGGIGLTELRPVGRAGAAETILGHKRSVREAERCLRMGGIAGDGRVFARSTVSKERLCELQEFLHNWMPCAGLDVPMAFLAVRSGIFAHAIAILEGKAGRRCSLDAAKDWIRGIDLLTCDVRQLDGVGPVYGAEWLRLRETAEIRALVARQREQAEAGD